MSRRRPSLKSFLAALLALALPACAAAPEQQELPELGLAGTIPVYWGEADGMEDMLSGSGEAHWARAQLETDYRLRPLDVLDETSLATLDNLLLAQPRALTPQENVALDAWVRGGGRLLLLADPLLTGETRYAIGDRRRPQDVILLSPLLDHWGLELEFVEDQPAGPQLREIAGTALPVNLPGRLVPSGAARDCTIAAQGLLARCRLGQGHATILADAAVLDLHEPHPAAAAALAGLVEDAFAQTGEGAQNGDSAGRQARNTAAAPESAGLAALNRSGVSAAQPPWGLQRGET